MQYRFLSDEGKALTLTEEIARFEREHYRHALALTTAEVMDDEASARDRRADLASLEAAIGVRVAALEEIGETT